MTTAIRQSIQTLLIEDDAKAVDLYRELLSWSRGFNYRVASVSTMAEARTILRMHSIDLVILDLKLPNGAGVKLVKEIRDLEPHAALVVVTGLDNDEDEMRAFAMLADEYILKGRHDGDETLRLVRNAVARSMARNDLESMTPHDGIKMAEAALKQWEDDPHLPPYPKQDSVHETAGVMDHNKMDSDKEEDTEIEPNPR